MRETRYLKLVAEYRAHLWIIDRHLSKCMYKSIIIYYVKLCLSSYSSWWFTEIQPSLSKDTTKTVGKNNCHRSKAFLVTCSTKVHQISVWSLPHVSCNKLSHRTLSIGSCDGFWVDKKVSKFQTVTKNSKLHHETCQVIAYRNLGYLQAPGLTYQVSTKRGSLNQIIQTYQDNKVCRRNVTKLFRSNRFNQQRTERKSTKFLSIH